MKLNLKSKKFKYGTVATVITVIVVAVIVLANVIISMIGNKTNLKIDLTPDSIFEISDVSKDYLKTINQDIEIVAFIDELVFQTSENIYYKQAYEVLKKYAVNSDKISLKFVDMTRDPTYVNKFSELYKGSISEYSIVVSSANRIKVISVNDLYNTEINYYTYSYEITSSKAEQVLTSAVMYVTDTEPLTAVILDAETSSASTENIKTMLSDNGFDIVTVNPLLDEIPADADMLVVNAPTNDFSEEIIKDIYDFLENNGNYGKNMIYLSDFSQKATTNIDAFLYEWGIEIPTSIIAESNSKNLATTASAFALKNYITENDYSANVAQPSLPVISYESRPISLRFETLGNVSTVPLLTTDSSSYALTTAMMEQMQQGVEPEIEYSNYNTMALASKYTFNSNNEQVTSNILVYGSSLMLEQGLTNTTYYNNGDYFISILTKMTGKTNGVTIVAKDLTAAAFDMDVAKFNIVRVIFMVILPVAVLACGLVVWLRRRHK